MARPVGRAHHEAVVGEEQRGPGGDPNARALTRPGPSEDATRPGAVKRLFWTSCLIGDELDQTEFRSARSSSSASVCRPAEGCKSSNDEHGLVERRGRPLLEPAGEPAQRVPLAASTIPERDHRREPERLLEAERTRIARLELG